jgi:hypothetical protein
MDSRLGEPSNGRQHMQKQDGQVVHRPTKMAARAKNARDFEFAMHKLPKRPDREFETRSIPVTSTRFGL